MLLDMSKTGWPKGMRCLFWVAFAVNVVGVVTDLALGSWLFLVPAACLLGLYVGYRRAIFFQREIVELEQQLNQQLEDNLQALRRATDPLKGVK
jgi:hypothetical protein